MCIAMYMKGLRIYGVCKFSMSNAALTCMQCTAFLYSYEKTSFFCFLCVSYLKSGGCSTVTTLSPLTAVCVTVSKISSSGASILNASFGLHLEYPAAKLLLLSVHDSNTMISTPQTDAISKIFPAKKVVSFLSRTTSFLLHKP